MGTYGILPKSNKTALLGSRRLSARFLGAGPLKRFPLFTQPIQPFIEKEPKAILLENGTWYTRRLDSREGRRKTAIVEARPSGGISTVGTRTANYNQRHAKINYGYRSSFLFPFLGQSFL